MTSSAPSRAALAVVVSFVLLSGAAFCRAETSFEGLKSRYFRLRNTDVAVSKPAEWASLAEELSRFAASEPASPDAPAALLGAAALRQGLAEVTRTSDAGASDAHARSALGAIGVLAARHPGSPLVPDALVRKGEILALLGDVDLSRAVLRRVASDHAATGAGRRAAALLSARGAGRGGGDGEDEERAEAAPRRAATPVVVLDPGHGGEDSGAVGHGGLVEKDLVLDVAAAVRERLARAGVDVRMTRRSDVFVPLQTRTEIANEAGADLFVSLHANASVRKRASGFEAYYLDNTKDAASKALAERENASVTFDDSGAGDIEFILSDLIQNGKSEDSVTLANVLDRSVMRTVRKGWPSARSLGVRKAPFYVLVGAHMPCVLLELFFIDSKSDGTLLSTSPFRTAVADGIASGVLEFLGRGGRVPTPGPALAAFE